MGESGHGKSTSVERLDPKSTAIINAAYKDLPFKGWKKNYTIRNSETKAGNLWNTSNPKNILAILDGIDKKIPEIKTIIIDDFQYVMSFEFVERATERGFDKFSEIAQNATNILRKCSALRDDLTVFILTHSETVYDAGGNVKIKLKTIGKMIDEKITPEGLSYIVLLAKIITKEEGTKYVFVKNSNGSTTVKSPKGMFDLEIPNDLQIVLDKIKEYEN